MPCRRAFWSVTAHDRWRRIWQREYARQLDGSTYGSYLYDVNRTSASNGLTTGTHHYFRTTNNGGSWKDADNNGGNTTGVELDMISENTGTSDSQAVYEIHLERRGKLGQQNPARPIQLLAVRDG